ncbi:unnamed protein product [Didymodactylos carnosus]|uniref:Uncharacterized protein n=1 Tax=Didymodactylos carnosus TaxID=1234261 RepID=A0A814BYC4_9BILA|nr:unnamed protein product [Didymodactylos carnosus]CAF3713622.1 unnamed protein product [Didymodactylos carnosus]
MKITPVAENNGNNNSYTNRPKTIDIQAGCYGCCHQGFNPTFPTKLKGIIAPSEFYQSIMNINRSYRSRPSWSTRCSIVLFIILLSLAITFWVLCSRKVRVIEVYIGIPVGFGISFLACGVCMFCLTRPGDREHEIRLQAAVNQESQTYSTRSPACHWRTDVKTETYTTTKFDHETWVTTEESHTVTSYHLSMPVVENLVEHSIFCSTTVGLYALICLRIEDLYHEKVEKRTEQFIHTIIKLLPSFDPLFQHFLLHHLHSSYKIIHNQAFIEELRSEHDLSSNQMYDKLFQSTLSLKEQCRLIIKDRVKSYPHDVKKLTMLSSTLLNYCTYDIFNPNYAQIISDRVAKYNGKVMPRVIPLPSSTGYQVQAESEFWSESDT